jgi:hypothetical protein
LIASKFDAAARELEKLRSDIVADVKKDFKTYKVEIMEDLEQNILARYVHIIVDSLFSGNSNNISQ